MARGKPAVLSGILSIPFILTGYFLFLSGPIGSVPSIVGIPVMGFGFFILCLGMYVEYIAAPEPPKMRDGEELIKRAAPSQRAALTKIGTGFLPLICALYLLFFTFHPYVYPTVLFFVGLYLLSSGLYTYLTNSLTTYYITDIRLIKEYRFISLVKQEIPFKKVRGVQERKSIWETLVGIGNVRVSSGGGASLEIVIKNIRSSTEFADTIRNLI